MQKQGLLLEATGPKPESVVVKDVSSSELQIKIAELTAELKKMEFEKRDLEFNLNRRLTDFKSQSEMNDQLKTQLSQVQGELETSKEQKHSMEVQLSNTRNCVMSLFIGMSQYLDVTCEKEDEIKPTLYTAVQQLFPKNCSESENPKTEIEMVILSAVDKVSLLKSRFKSQEQELKVKSDMLASQDKQVANLLAVTDSDKSTITRLRESLSQLKSSVQEKPSGTSDASEQEMHMVELERTNESLHKALQSMRMSMEQQKERLEESESQLVKLQEELVSVQKSSSEMVQQMFTANEARMKQMEEDKAKLQSIAEETSAEVTSLRLALEQATKEYEHELAVLREKRYVVEEQISVSEKFLDSTTRAHREELTKLSIAQQEAQRETQELRMQLVEKEEELRSCMESLDVLREQSREQIKVLTSQLRVSEQKLAEEMTRVEQERHSLRESENQIDTLVADRVSAVEQKEREASRMQQRQYEEEVNDNCVYEV